jgi:hypothetical protein
MRCPSVTHTHTNTHRQTFFSLFLRHPYLLSPTIFLSLSPPFTLSFYVHTHSLTHSHIKPFLSLSLSLSFSLSLENTLISLSLSPSPQLEAGAFEGNDVWTFQNVDSTHLITSIQAVKSVASQRRVEH